MTLCFLKIPHVSDNMKYLSFCAWFILPNMSFRIHPCGTMHQNFLPFKVWIISLYMYRPHFIYLFFYWWTFGLLLCVMLPWMWMYKYLFETLLSIILDIYLEVKFLNHMVIVFNFLRNHHDIFIVPTLLYIPSSSIQVSNSSTSLPALVLFVFVFW